MAIKYDGQGNYAHSAVCYIQVRSAGGTEFVPVKSAKTYNNNYGLDLFLVTKDITSEDGKRKLSSAGSIVDGMTGIKICNLEDFESCIKNHGINKVRDTIHSMVEKYGWSPRYLRPNEKKVDVFPKNEKDDEDRSIMVTPLFENGMFNRAGKRMRAKYVKTVSCDGESYDLYISGSKIPDRDYGNGEDDRYYLHIWRNGWLIPISMTERYLRQNAVREHVVAKLYGNEESREEFFDKLRGNRPYYETEQLVKDQIKKEEKLEVELSQDGRYIAEYIKAILEQHVETYIDCKNGTGRFPDFIGAVLMNDVENCVRLSEIRKQREAEEQEKRRIEAEEKARLQAIADAEKVAADLVAAEEIMLNGGKITDGAIICALADKHKVSIPLRTRGWILNSFASCEISGNDVSVRFWKTKNGTGSTKIHEIIGNIRSAVENAGAVT